MFLFNLSFYVGLFLFNHAVSNVVFKNVKNLILNLNLTLTLTLNLTLIIFILLDFFLIVSSTNDFR